MWPELRLKEKSAFSYEVEGICEIRVLLESHLNTTMASMLMLSSFDLKHDPHIDSPLLYV